MPNISEVRVKDHYLVTVHRRFAEAIFDTPLSIYEQRILYTVLSNIEPPVFLQDENKKNVLDEDGNKIITNYISELPVFEMNLKEFGNLLNIKEISHVTVRKVMRDFKKKGLEIHRLDRKDEEIDARDYRGINFLLESEYLYKENAIRIEFSPKLLPYVANLTSEFVSVPLKAISKFTSKYSSKLFLLMQQWHKVETKEFELDELKGMLGIPFEVEHKNGKPVRVYKYDDFTNFKLRALEPAINEINELSELNIDFEVVKKSRKVNKIKFFISKKVKTSTKKTNPEKKSYALNEFLILEVFGDVLSGDMFYKNSAEALKDIENLDANRDLELEVYVGLVELKTYLLRQKISNPEGFIISEIRKMVKSYNEKGLFASDTLKNTRTEKLPEWFKKDEKIQNDRLEFERNQPYTVLRKEVTPQPETPNPETPNELPEAIKKSTVDFEDEKQKILTKLALKRKK